MNEEWRPVVGLETYFEVSDHGNVRWRSTKELIPSHKGTNYGHRRVYLGIGSPKQRYVHRLVLETFAGPCPKGLQCCHNDGDATNNRLDNLRWDTPSSNMHDRVKHGTHHHTNRTHCPHGHPLDSVKRRPDGSIKQRRCGTCAREDNRARAVEKYAQKTTCPQGHPFNGVAYNPDGSVRQRFCKQCRSESVSRQMSERHAKARAGRTHCDKGHVLDGERVRPSGAVYRWCRKCANEAQRLKKTTS